MSLHTNIPNPMGVETEYFAHTRVGGEDDPLWLGMRLGEMICLRQAGNPNYQPKNVDKYVERLGRRWRTCGDCVYIDVGSHPEYATAELFSGDQVAIHKRQGDLFLTHHVSEIHQRCGPDFQFFLNGNNVASDSGQSEAMSSLRNRVSVGCHLNFLVPKGFNFGRMRAQLTPYLVTAQTVEGAGLVTDLPNQIDPSLPYGFEISQRGRLITTYEGSLSTIARPLFHTGRRGEPLANPERFCRLHFLHSDTNGLYLPFVLKMDFLDLLLKMVQADALDSPRLAQDPIEALHTVCLNWKAPLAMADGSIKSAIDIQWEYCRQAAHYLAKNDLAYYKPVVDWRFRILDHLRQGRFEALIGKHEWVTKWLWIEKQRQRLAKKEQGDPYICMLWDMTWANHYGSRLRMPDKLWHKYGPAHFPELTNRLYGLPAGRARLRSQLVVDAEKSSNRYWIGDDWQQMAIHTGRRRRIRLEMDDPFLSEPSAKMKKALA